MLVESTAIATNWSEVTPSLAAATVLVTTLFDQVFKQLKMSPKEPIMSENSFTKEYNRPPSADRLVSRGALYVRNLKVYLLPVGGHYEKKNFYCELLIVVADLYMWPEPRKAE